MAGWTGEKRGAAAMAEPGDSVNVVINWGEVRLVKYRAQARVETGPLAAASTQA